MGILNFFGGGNSSTDAIQEYLDKGAIVLDVRSQAEYDSGHVEGSVLIVKEEIQSRVSEIKSWDKPVIVVCRSGGRAGSVLPFIQNAGVDAINGGAWQNANR